VDASVRLTRRLGGIHDFVVEAEHVSSWLEIVDAIE